MPKWFILPFISLWISFPQETSIIGRWKSTLDDANTDLVYMTFTFYADHSAELDYMGLVSKGSWHWENGLNGYKISFFEEGQTINVNMQNAELRNDTLFFDEKVMDKNGLKKPKRNYILRMK